jgi:hypothetical protein
VIPVGLIRSLEVRHSPDAKPATRMAKPSGQGKSRPCECQPLIHESVINSLV